MFSIDDAYSGVLLASPSSRDCKGTSDTNEMDELELPTISLHESFILLLLKILDINVLYHFRALINRFCSFEASDTADL